MSLSLFQEHICFYSRALRRTYESSFHGWCRHLLFFNSVLETKTFCTFYSINFASHLQKEISMVAVWGKKINCKDLNSKLYFSKGIQNNLPRSNFSLLRLPQMLLEKTEKWEIWLPDCHFSCAETWELVTLFVRTKSFSYHMCYENIGREYRT